MTSIISKKCWLAKRNKQLDIEMFDSIREDRLKMGDYYLRMSEMYLGLSEKATKEAEKANEKGLKLKDEIK